MTDERTKQLMEGMGMPNSTSLKLLLEQVANETEQEVRKKIAQEIEMNAIWSSDIGDAVILVDEALKIIKW
jgi:antitoxin component of RelBE/YafQ-DinJ toxin-antitoxin module